MVSETLDGWITYPGITGSFSGYAVERSSVAYSYAAGSARLDLDFSNATETMAQVRYVLGEGLIFECHAVPAAEAARGTSTVASSS